MSPLPIDIAAALARRPCETQTAAQEWCEDAPYGQVFLTADAKLRKATLLTGFDAI
jgi:hypothetical protein